jgi:hypothetical protein
MPAAGPVGCGGLLSNCTEHLQVEVLHPTRQAAPPFQREEAEQRQVVRMIAVVRDQRKLFELLICLRLFWHCSRTATSRTFYGAGSNSATSTPMMAITTSTSISVKPERFDG